MPARSSIVLFASVCVGVWVRPQQAQAAPVDVPLNIGVGPAALIFAGPMYNDQPIHTGLRLHLKAVLDDELVHDNPDAMPAVLEERVRKQGALHIGHWAIPETVHLSPRRQQTSVWGATWRMGSYSTSLLRSPRLVVGAGFIFTYAVIRSRALRSPTTFARPGADVRVELEIALSKRFLISLGCSSQLYLPQRLGQPVFGSLVSSFRHLRQSIWHIGEAHLLLHARVPVEANL